MNAPTKVIETIGNTTTIRLIKLTLPVPNDSDYRMLFSNTNTPHPYQFQLLMVFHKSKKGGFNYPVTKEQCQKALSNHNENYIYCEVM